MITKILVANSSAAHFYHIERLHADGKVNIRLTKTEDLSHLESRERVLDLVSDKSGSRQASSKSNTANGYEYKHDPKELEAENFAIELIKKIYNECGLEKEDEFLFIAPPHFHQLFTKHWRHPSPVIQYVPKDYTKHTMKELTERIQEYFYEKI